MVSEFLYPAFMVSPPSFNFHDQCAFRPTTAALISFLQTVTDFLLHNQFVSFIALDFSKAFDTLRHSTVLNKITRLAIRDAVYNWPGLLRASLGLR